MKKLFLSTLLLALPLLASALCLDGIYYYLNSVEKTAEVTYQKYVNNVYSSDYSGSVVIPEKFTHEGVEYSVTSIGHHAFSGCSGLTSVTIPNSVTSIGYQAFYGCSSLTSVTIPNSMTSIGNSAFSNCSGLTSVTIPNSVTIIGDYAFQSCSGLTSVTIPNSVTSIRDYAFQYCSGLTSVTIPNSVNSIGSYVFASCINLTSVTIGNSVTSIGDYAFSGCRLTSVTIPNSVTSIGSYAFYSCSGLTSVTIPNSVTSIGDHAFSYCSGLTSVHITDLAGWCKIAFSGDFSNPLSYAHHLYLNGEEIKDLVIPNSVTSIGVRAFQACTGFTSVTIPNSVISIGSYAFSYCKNIETINSKISKLFEIKENVFDSETYINAILKVPVGTAYKYQNTAAWNKFLAIEESDDSGEQGGDAEMVDLCIQDSEKGELTIGLEKGKSHTLTITPENGWKVYMIIFNNKNVTAQLNGNKFIIPALTGKSYLNISYEQTSDVNSAKTIPMLISAHEGKIIVNSEAEGQTVNVYTMDGKVLGSGVIRNGKATIQTNQPSGESFIVKAGSRSVKIKM